MAFNMLLLSLSVLLLAKATLGKIDCDDICERPEQMKYIPREISAFNDYCVASKSHLRCMNDWQNECGSDYYLYFETQKIFEGMYGTLSEICEDGTLLNTIATENLKCFNETFEKTKCTDDAFEFIMPFIEEARNNEDSQPKFTIFCLRDTLVHDCVARAVSDNCGEVVGEAALDALHRSKSLGNACSVNGAQSVLDELENLDLSEDKIRSMRRILEKLVEENSK